ncbi:YcdB/YcdC domain-containing protein [Clostridium saccharobutylicum]|uniref:YcdB/YcdC domain-containing protein n=1 Tax=Clostridium saccharobutylicum TaxID=169679 RepID=UPI00156DB867|nr:YcdB/YcdC domain-containing protein [Clostridium saccharobutylicum]NSC05310.1 hypothetical protein [Clostridium saccharobutylicum]
MKLKKGTIKASIVLVFLLMVIGIVVYNFIGPGAKDMKASKDFIAKLYLIKAINTDQPLDSMKYDRIKILTSKNELGHKTIVTQNFGIDLDKEDNVIGFAKKEIPKNITKLNIEEGKELADYYLKNIYDGDVIIKASKSNEDNESLPYYSFVYTKEEHGYPLYFDEIKLNIDKESGVLDGYSNSTMQRECKEPVINISKEEAEKIALESFEKYNKDGTLEDEIPLVYADNTIDTDSKTISEVCYLVNIKGKDKNNKKVEWKIFVSAETGNILNKLKDGAEKEVTTS